MLAAGSEHLRFARDNYSNMDGFQEQLVDVAYYFGQRDGMAAPGWIDHYDGTDINVRGGGTQGGGGASQRLQLTQGIAWKKLSGVVGLELNHTQPLTFGDRRLTSSYTRGAVDPTTSAPAVAGVTDRSQLLLPGFPGMDWSDPRNCP